MLKHLREGWSISKFRKEVGATIFKAHCEVLKMKRKRPIEEILLRKSGQNLVTEWKRRAKEEPFKMILVLGPEERVSWTVTGKQNGWLEWKMLWAVMRYSND